jgi:hypothetical protein
MFTYNFTKSIINKDIRDYIKKSNDNAFNKINKIKDNKNITYKINNNNMNKEHTSDYEINFCDLSENCDCNECNEYKNRIKLSKKDDNKKMISYKGNKYFSFFLMVLGGGSFISISLLCYNNYIKK